MEEDRAAAVGHIKEEEDEEDKLEQKKKET